MQPVRPASRIGVARPSSCRAGRQCAPRTRVRGGVREGAAESSAPRASDPTLDGDPEKEQVEFVRN